MGKAILKIGQRETSLLRTGMGFWSCMDTYKEKQTLDEMYERGNTPWEVWKHNPSSEVASDSAIKLPPANDATCGSRSLVVTPFIETVQAVRRDAGSCRHGIASVRSIEFGSVPGGSRG